MPQNPSGPSIDAGSRFADRRAFPRFAFDAYAEMVEPIAKMRVIGHVIEISQGGCFIELSDTPAARIVVRLRIDKDTHHSVLGRG